MDFDPGSIEDLVSAVSIEDYYIPFNTNVPMVEFDSIGEVVNHWNRTVDMDPSDPKTLVKAPRKIKPFDILITSYKVPYTRSVFLLLPKLGKKDWMKINESAQQQDDVKVFPGAIANQFHAVSVVTSDENSELIAELIEPENH